MTPWSLLPKERLESLIVLPEMSDTHKKDCLLDSLICFGNKFTEAECP